MPNITHPAAPLQIVLAQFTHVVPPPVRHDFPLVIVIRQLHFGIKVHVNRIVLSGMEQPADQKM